MTITDNAHLISQSKDTTTYQHASTLQLFRTVEQVSGNKLELLIFTNGVWQSEGIFTANQIAHQVANPA
jgi:hypothetical protein